MIEAAVGIVFMVPCHGGYDPEQGGEIIATRCDGPPDSIPPTAVRVLGCYRSLDICTGGCNRYDDTFGTTNPQKHW